MTAAEKKTPGSEFEIFRNFDKAMEEFERNNPPPKCHFKHMQELSSDYESWYECDHCGHTKLIGRSGGER